MTSLQKAAKTILNSCMGLKQNESCLIVTDNKKRKIANILLKEARKISEKCKLITKPIGRIHGEEPSKKIAKEMLKYDVILLVTTKSLSHTIARKNAVEKGARVASMPGIAESILKRAINVNYKQIQSLNNKIAKRLTKGKKVKIVTKKGTNLIFSIKGREGKADTGIYINEGNWGNLPAGETAIAPLECTANGTLVVDASMSDIGKTNQLTITIKNGYAIKFKGKESKKLKNLIKDLGKSARNIAEFGIGTNPKAKVTGTVLEDEKVLGTAHIALGDNISLGGAVKAKCHLDGVFFKPTIYVDNKKIMKDGKSLL